MAKKLSTIKKKAWTEFSRYIRMRDADENGMVKCCTCIYVAHWKKMQAGHFIGGRCNSILFLEDNCHAQCYGCNFRSQGNGPEYYPFMVEKYGYPVIAALKRVRRQTVKFTYSEMEVMYLKYKELAADCENG